MTRDDIRYLVENDMLTVDGRRDLLRYNEARCRKYDELPVLWPCLHPRGCRRVTMITFNLEVLRALEGEVVMERLRNISACLICSGYERKDM